MVRLVSGHPHDELFDFSLDRLLELALKNASRVENFSLSVGDVPIPRGYRGGAGMDRVQIASKPDNGFYDSSFLFARLGIALGQAMVEGDKIDDQLCNSLTNLVSVWSKHDEETERMNRGKRKVLIRGHVPIPSLNDSKYVQSYLCGCFPLSAYDLVYNVSHSGEAEALLFLVDGYDFARNGKPPIKSSKCYDSGGPKPMEKALEKRSSDTDFSIVDLGHLFNTMNSVVHDDVDHRTAESVFNQMRDKFRESYVCAMNDESGSHMGTQSREVHCQRRRKYWSAYNALQGFVGELARHRP